jgi:hypothetical protein
LNINTNIQRAQPVPGLADNLKVHYTLNLMIQGPRLSNFFAVAIALMALTVTAMAEESHWNDVTIVPADLTNPKAPRFADYAVAPAFLGVPRPVDLASHPEAKMWRTRIREGARNGPNFADHFTVVTWGCGTDCTGIAIVDSRNGAVFFPKALGALHTVNIHDKVLEEGTLHFRRESRLLVAVGMPNEDTAQRGVSYYEWTGNDLKLVFRVKRKWYHMMSDHPMQPIAGSGGRSQTLAIRSHYSCP